MRIPLLWVQVLLLVLWYAVPAMAFVPWWVIFLPLLAFGAIMSVILLIPVVGFLLICLLGIIEGLVNWRRRRRYR